MKRKFQMPVQFRLFVFFLIVCLFTIAITPAQAQQGAASPVSRSRNGGPLTPQVSSSINVVESAPLAEIEVVKSDLLAADSMKVESPSINKPIPRPGRSTRGPDTSLEFTVPLTGPSLPAVSDVPAVRSFDGLSALDDAATISAVYAPPDTDGAVGPDHYIQMVNSIYAIYDKDTGAILGGPYANNALWVSAATGDACEAQNDGDPVVLYDQLADRWLISQFALPNFPDGPFYECIAVSSSGDPLGVWYLYTFQISATKMDDYPKFGIWPDGYYMSVNQFNANTLSWAGTGVAAFERDQMLTGSVAQMVYFDNASDDIGGLLPSNLQGATVPPVGEPNYFVQASDEAWGVTGSDALRVWAFDVDWVTPANSTFTNLGDLTTDAFDTDMCGYSRDCIAQPGTTQKVDAISDRLMYLLQYRNFTTYQTMVVNHTVDMGSDHAGIRWYELRNTGAGWSIYQQGDYSPDSDQRWMGSMSMDGDGNIALGYSVSSSTTYPSVRYTGRLDGDTLGTMTQGENTLVNGSGSQLGVNRWGDYSSMMIDPVDDCTFWYTQEYVKTTGSFNWATRIGAFKFTSCGTAWGSLEGTVDDGSNPVEGAIVAITGGATATTNASGFYSFPGLPAGSYDMTVTKYGFNEGSATGVAVTDGNVTTQDFTLIAKSMSTVSGTVTDANTGAPLSATIYIPEYPGSPVATNPSTGEYSIQLEYGTDHHFTVLSTGYISGTATVGPASPTLTQDFALDVDIAACTAPGYTRVTGFSQSFNDASFPPSGWTVSDIAGNSVVWDFSSNWLDGNYTGGTGDASDANSDAAGFAEFDTVLTSPTITVASLPGKYLTYLANYQNYGGRDYLELDIKVDSADWVNVLSWNEDHGTLYNTPGQNVSVDLSSYLSGHTNFKLRWHYFDPNSGDWDWYAQIDDVRIGNCVSLQATTFKSAGSQDGWILESTETSNTGGSLNASATTFRLGDDAANRQYRAILSFNTASLPTNAVITSAVIKIRKSGAQTGSNPFNVLTSLLADIRKPYFGSASTLQLADFKASSSATKVATFNETPIGGWYSAVLNSAGRNNINKNNLTQFRLYFSKDDNNDLGADFMKFFSGNASASNRPILIVNYYEP